MNEQVQPTGSEAARNGADQYPRWLRNGSPSNDRGKRDKHPNSGKQHGDSDHTPGHRIVRNHERRSGSVYGKIERSASLIRPSPPPTGVDS
jgi:hypothetical protein